MTRDLLTILHYLHPWLAGCTCGYPALQRCTATHAVVSIGVGDEIRTHDRNLGKTVEKAKTPVNISEFCDLVDTIVV